MASLAVPSHTQILVIGGGPGGSYSATCLAREGFSVVLLEASKFPRYHIGESLLPSMRQFLRFIDAEELVSAQGYAHKPGAAFKLNQAKREGYTDFSPLIGSWNVLRSDFDNLLLRHAADSGVNVIQETKVTDIVFEGSRPIAALWKSVNGSEGRINFDYLVDASGRNGIMSVKYLKNRRFNQSLKNVAYWGYWTGTSKYMPGTDRDNAVFIEGLKDESGWAWFIPLAGGVVSVGVVVDKDKATAKRKLYDIADLDEKNYQYYMDELGRSPSMAKLLGGGTMKTTDGRKGLKTTSDFSYDSDRYGGDHYRIVGDAGAFVDPLFSSGVHLAMTGALSAALTIASSIRGTVVEDKAAQWHSAKIRTAYTRFLVVVLGTYQQLLNQKMDIMSSVEEDNFDRAFELIGPVITGSVDVGKAQTPEEVEESMKFVLQFFAPEDPEAKKAAEARVEYAGHKSDSLNELYVPKQNFAQEIFYGMSANVERGTLSLVIHDN